MNDEPLSDDKIEEYQEWIKGKYALHIPLMAREKIKCLLATIDQRTKELDDALLCKKVFKHNWFFFEDSANRNAKENEESKKKTRS